MRALHRDAEWVAVRAQPPLGGDKRLAWLRPVQARPAFDREMPSKSAVERSQTGMEFSGDRHHQINNNQNAPCGSVTERG